MTEYPRLVAEIPSAKTVILFTGAQLTVEPLNSRRTSTVEMVQCRMPVLANEGLYTADSIYSKEGNHSLRIKQLGSLSSAERDLLKSLGIANWEEYGRYLKNAFGDHEEWNVRSYERLNFLRYQFRYSQVNLFSQHS